jgi:hypothetical protein
MRQEDGKRVPKEMQPVPIHSNARLFGFHVQVPVNATILSIALLQPFITLGEVLTVELFSVSLWQY